jgi:hypothetical protein
LEFGNGWHEGYKEASSLFLAGGRAYRGSERGWLYLPSSVEALGYTNPINPLPVTPRPQLSFKTFLNVVFTPFCRTSVWSRGTWSPIRICFEAAAEEGVFCDCFPPLWAVDGGPEDGFAAGFPTRRALVAFVTFAFFSAAGFGAGSLSVAFAGSTGVEGPRGLRFLSSTICFNS